MGELSSLTLVILCGGKGKRLGGAVKALLRSTSGDRLTILERLERALAPCAAEVVLVATPVVAEKLARVSSRRIIHDRGRGPGAALISAAKDTSSEWMLVVGGDQPRPSRKLLERLTAAAGPNVDHVRCVFGGVPQPLWALYRRSAVAIAEDPSRGVALVTIARALRVVDIPGEELPDAEKSAFLDADTPEDLEKLGLALDPGET